MKIPVSGAALVGRKRCTILHEKIRGILGTGSSQKKKKGGCEEEEGGRGQARRLAEKELERKRLGSFQEVGM